MGKSITMFDLFIIKKIQIICETILMMELLVLMFESCMSSFGHTKN